MILSRSRALLGAAIAAIAFATQPALANPEAAEHQHHHAGHHAVSAEVQQAEGQKLRAIFAADDEANLRRNPIGALFRGDMRYADQLGDFITDAYFDGERAAAQFALDELQKIDRSKLNEQDQLAFDIFKQANNDALTSLSPELMALTVVRPLNHFSGFHTFYPNFSSGKGGAPFKTVEDYDNNLKRHGQYRLIIERSIGRFRQGMESGVVETKMTIRNVIAQLDTQIAMPLAQNPFMGPVAKFPDSFSAEDKARLTADYTATTTELMDTYRQLRAFLNDEYLPVAREGVGLVHMKGGDRLYAHLIENTTTLPLQAEEVHQLGLSEVARIRGEMDAIRIETGFTGDLKAFFDHLRTDPQFKPASREGLTQSYYDVGKQVDERIGALFSTIPKSPLEIRPYEEYREKYEAGGSYESGTADGSRPGRFYFNAYDLPSRTTPGITTLYLHEGAPGHHFQISLAQENTALPAFMRYGGNTAFVEGWALYAEKLGFDMKLFDDPYQRFGHFDDEMLRAMRLVVDTGIHAKGWTREQAIQYMLDNSSMGTTDATAEVERYIAIPSQALAYKIGQLTILRLREKARSILGDKFDIRSFHAEVLNTGALPMTVLEAKIDRWIERQK